RVNYNYHRKNQYYIRSKELNELLIFNIFKHTFYSSLNEFVRLNCHNAMTITNTDNKIVKAAESEYWLTSSVNLYIQYTKISVPPAVDPVTEGPPLINK